MSDAPPPYPMQDKNAGYPPAQYQHQGAVEGAPPPGMYPPINSATDGSQPVSYNTIPPTQPVVVAVKLGEVPVAMVCPHCHENITTYTHHKSGLLTWLICGGCCFFGIGWLGCCFIPFCVDACKDVVHVCPNCKKEVGVYSRLS